MAHSLVVARSCSFGSSLALLALALAGTACGNAAAATPAVSSATAGAQSAAESSAPTPSLTLPSDTASGALDTPAGALTAPCAPATSGREQVFALHVAARTGIAVRVHGTLPTRFHGAVSLRRACADAPAEIACTSASYRDAYLLRAAVDPGDYELVLDHADDTAGSFALELSSYEPAANATCDAALALTDGAVVTHEDAAGGGAPLGDPICLARYETPALYYTVTVPAGATLTATATPSSGSDARPQVRIAESCDVSDGCALDYRPARYTNTGTDARTVVIAVDSQVLTIAPRPAPFDLAIAIAPAASE